MKSLLSRLVLCVLIAMSALSLDSCKKSKVFTSEVEVIEGHMSRGRDSYVNYQGKAYTGDVWANDESCYQTFKNGILKGGVIFHPNGKKALEVTINDDDDREFKFYDEQGKQISRDEFERKYEDVVRSTDGKLPIR